MRQRIRSIKQDILHSIFPAVRAGPQSVHLSWLLSSLVCCLLLEQHNTVASEEEEHYSRSAAGLDGPHIEEHPEVSACLSTHSMISSALDS